jgi:hypothetical protein
MLILLLRITCLILEYCVSSHNLCEQNRLFEGLEMFSFSGHTDGVVSTHFATLERANLNHWA